MNDHTYSVRIEKVEPRKNAQGKVTSYRVRWTVEGKEWKESFKLSAQADAFRAELLTAAKQGEAFTLSTGRPVSQTRQESGPTWYVVALNYVDSKWPYASPNHRRGIAESITDATEALLSSQSGAPSRRELRTAMLWATSTRIQASKSAPPAGIAETLGWLERNTVRMTAFTEPKTGAALSRSVLDRISRKQDGSLAAARTALRKRAVLNNLMGYAIESDVLVANPLKAVKWTRPKTSEQVDVRTVLNTDQAQRFLTAVSQLGDMGARLEAFFGCMYYAALRPEEVIALLRTDLADLPETGWGEMRLAESEPAPGKRWTANGKSRERRELKHRPIGATRPVPIHPELVALLRRHLETFPNTSGYVFRGPRGGTISDSTYLPYFRKARTAAFTEAEAASPLAAVPYALRHAAVSTWLNAGVPATQVAEWAGHSLEVLLRVYAKCIVGQDTEAKRRILEATSPAKTEKAKGNQREKMPPGEPEEQGEAP